ncbi:MAG: agmatine deiminase family protein [Prevotella sp.]|nr:agmatine deiminase family protein [Prevotella sp.]
MNNCQNASNALRMPAEWEPQAFVQFTWPHAGTDWAPYLSDITETCREMVCAVSRYEPVVIAAQEPDLVRQLLPEKTAFPVTILPCRNDDTWARDHAFITLVPTQEADSGALPHLLDFRFNGWGDKFPADNDNRINRQLFDQQAFRGIYEPHLDFVLEGGSIESDGEGTVFTTSQCLLAPHRNQPLQQRDIEQQLKERLHARRIVWLDHGQLAGDDTDGHIDTIVRLAPRHTLLYIHAHDTNDPHYDDLQALERQLRSLDYPGKRLIALPMPRPICDEDERLPATYANFLVVNGAVIVPTYAQEDLDKEACEAIGRAFPGRDIIPIDSRTIIRQHGSIHCMTMQYPTVAAPDWQAPCGQPAENLQNKQPIQQ